LRSGWERVDGQQERECGTRLLVRPFAGGDGAAAIVIAAGGVVDYTLFGF
jgi:hypothetical protein